MNGLVEIKNLTKSYRKGGWFAKAQEKTILHDVTLSLQKHEILGLVGESGCGKTTLAKVILGLEPYQSGSVQVLGQELNKLNKAQFQRLRRDMQVVFQDPYSSLDPRMTVQQILSEPWDIHGLHKEGSVRAGKLKELMQSVGLDPAHLHRYPHEFSGGQRQRIAIARALALEPKILVADEPVSALDVSVQAQILNLLKEIARQRGLSILFVSHDFGVARFLCDRIAVMYQGQIVECGPAESLLKNPQHPYTEALLSAVPLPDPSLQKNREPVSGKMDLSLAGSMCPYAARCNYYNLQVCEQPLAMAETKEKGHLCACACLAFKDTKSRWSV